jgi:hypothetical protein
MFPEKILGDRVIIWSIIIWEKMGITWESIKIW